MRHFLLHLMLVTGAFGAAIDDDGDPATGRAMFSWVQDPSAPIVEIYKVTFWRTADQTPETGITLTVPTAPQTGPVTPGEVIIDGFTEDTRYGSYVKAATLAGEESDPSDIIYFLYSTDLPEPLAPVVVTDAELIPVELQTAASDGNPATVPVMFTWGQTYPTPGINAYKVCVWEDGQSPALSIDVIVPSAPQAEGMTTRHVRDGFVPGHSYFVRVYSQAGEEQSAGTLPVRFTVPSITGKPKNFGVEILR